MNLKIMTSILVLLALSGSSVCLDPLYLGSGLRDQVINLDAGSKLPEESYQFARSGFVTPRMPQPMALSPNIMINQAKNLIDEALSAKDKAISARDEAKASCDETVAARNDSLSARDEAKASYDEAASLFAKIEEKEKNIESLLKRAETGADASAANAAHAGDFSNKTAEAYNKTLSLYKEIDGNLGQIKSILQEARDYANASARSANLAKESMNLTYQSHNETAGESLY
ncbi:MAG: hypothetical protein A4E48_01853 [Methanosaeta sp. PtaU1.Bin060]|nr:MAG: hypothetical protein A4E48_01853 [Methanosaeta sp. PtaU1.Bin060]